MFNPRFLEKLREQPELALRHDLNHPDFNPPHCPEWMKESLPASMLPYRGRNGQPHPYRTRDYPLAATVEGIDRYHANQFLVYRPETAEFIYNGYTSLDVGYQKGLLPAFEKLSEEVTRGCRTDLEKARAFVKEGIDHFPHPHGVPRGKWVEANRNLDDEALLESGVGWCNEQARVFIRLCQVHQIPARLVHFFYSTEKTGHAISEFYVDGHWCMADTTLQCVFPDEKGRLLSAAECHDAGRGQRLCAMAYQKRTEELLACTDEELNLTTPEEIREWREKAEAQSVESFEQRLYYFAVINYPLPK